MIVDCSGIAIMGGFEQGIGPSTPTSTDAPVIKISGMALMGGVEIIYRFPGESSKDAKLRRRRERKQLKSGQQDQT
jgi:hypothetical protein